jgi:hypothetical protein
MRRYYVDKEAIQIATDLYSSVNFVRKGKSQIDLLVEYRDSLDGLALETPVKQVYINKIIDELPEILKAPPTKIYDLIIEFNAIIPVSEIGTSFYENIVSSLMYDELRQEILPALQNLDLKTCVYCNSQLTIVVNEYYKITSPKRGFKKGDIKKHIGRFDLDHIEPKSKYPFLAATFFNLVPSCAHCNRHKSQTEIPFKFYTEDSTELDVFNFELVDESIEKYWKTGQASDLKFDFTHLGNDANKAIRKKHAKTFKIPEIYETQKDVFEELVHLSEIYTDEAQEDLVDSFINLFPDKSMVHRLIIGNYTKPEELYKRPLAKFTQDIARQLKLI